MTTPAGWYDDGSGRQRYWDGSQWTEHFADQQAAPPPPAAAQEHGEQPKKKSRLGLWIGLGIGGFVILIGGAITAFVFFVLNLTAGPREAFDEMAEAWREGDCPAEYSLWSSAATSGLTQDQWCDGADYSWAQDGWEYSITSTNITNGTGTIETRETTVDGVRETWEYVFVNEDGQWLMDQANIQE